MGTPKNSVGRKSRNCGGGLLVLEAFEQAHAAAADQPAVQAVAERVDVKQRQREQEAVGCGDLPAGEQVDGVRGEVVVREDRAFGRAGGAGGIDDAGRSIAIQRHDGALCGHGGGLAVSSAGLQTGTGAAKGSVETTALGSASLQNVGASRDRDRGC